MGVKKRFKTPVGELPPLERNQNFEEVVLGYTVEEAVAESLRCLECKDAPCKAGCPVGVDIPGFIHHVKNQDFAAAYAVITEENALPAICGRVCPQETQCEGRCVRIKAGESVAIGRLEGFVADYMEEQESEHSDTHDKNQRNLTIIAQKKVAVIGSGPAGLTCAFELAKAGASVTLFEALHKIGGVLTYGIPEFRLPKRLVEKERLKLERLGVNIQTNTLIGRSFTIEQLKEQGFEAVFIGSGAGLPKFMDIPGENFKGVYSANEYLTRVNLMKAYQDDAKTPIQQSQQVVVIGGGNVAMDAARTAKRLGAESVTIVYRRGEDELPARKEEIHHAKEEGILFQTLNSPLEITGIDYAVTGLVCQKMTLGDPDASNRRSPVPIPDALHNIPCDTVIIAIGQNPNPLIQMTTPSLETHTWGGIKADVLSMATNLGGIYAGGDAVTGAATVIKAMGAGKIAAREMLRPTE